MKLKVNEIAKEFENLKKAENAHTLNQELFVKREALETKIQRLKKEIHHLRITLKSSASQELELNELRIEKQMIDHLLDETDDLNEESIQENYSTLLQNFAEFSGIKERSLDFQNQRNLINYFSKVKTLLETINEFFLVTVHARNSIKGKGFWRYVFGVSPNAIIERHLLLTVDLVRKNLITINELEEICSETEYEGFSSTIKNLIIQTHESCQKIWDFKFIDGSIVPLMEKLDACRALCEEKICELEQSIRTHKLHVCSELEKLVLEKN